MFTKEYIFKGIGAAALIAACGAAGYFGAAANCPKTAVVNVPALLEHSSQVMALKAENEKNTAELRAWVVEVQKEIAKQKTDAKKKEIAKKHDAELAAKQQAYTKEYTEKLKEIDKEITRVVVERAEAEGYELVLPKTATLYGGDNITDAIVPFIK